MNQSNNIIALTKVCFIPLKAYGAYLGLANEECINWLYNLIKLTKNNIFDIVIERFNRVDLLNTVTVSH